MARCISGDPFCGIFELCRHCQEELRHQRELELIRARANMAREVRLQQEARNDAIVHCAVEHPKATLGILAGALAFIAGVSLATNRNKKHR
jgi:hypothetical protein